MWEKERERVAHRPLICTHVFVHMIVRRASVVLANRGRVDQSAENTDFPRRHWRAHGQISPDRIARGQEYWENHILHSLNESIPKRLFSFLTALSDDFSLACDFWFSFQDTSFWSVQQRGRLWADGAPRFSSSYCKSVRVLHLSGGDHPFSQTRHGGRISSFGDHSCLPLFHFRNPKRLKTQSKSEYQTQPWNGFTIHLPRYLFFPLSINVLQYYVSSWSRARIH